MPFCNKCGTEMPGGSGFCHSCGTPQGTTEPKAANQNNNENEFKTQVRQKPVYGVINLEDLPKGHIIDERYEIIKKLGQGGFGAVYKAFDKKMEIDKALKVLPEAIVNDLSAMNTIKTEATTMVRLDHPNIVRVFDFQDKGDIKYIDMQFVDGKDLHQIRFESEGERLKETEAKKSAHQIAKGLAYAHANNVIHKDIKPQNILVSKSGDVKIMDFGISETVTSSMSRVENSSSSGTLVYMSPEQIRGKDVGKEADIYSFGAMLYELLSGKPPFHKGAIEHQILNEQPTEIDGISNEMNTFLLKCLAKDYTDRYRNFDEVLSALDGKQPVMPDPDPVSTAKSGKTGKEIPDQVRDDKTGGYLKKAIFGSIGLVAVIIIAIFVISSGNDEKSTQTRETAAVSVPVKKPVHIPKKESKAGYNTAISNFDKKIRAMQKRLNDGTPESGDSLKALNGLIVEKGTSEKKLAAFIQKEKTEVARRQKEADDSFMKQFKADIQDYKDVVNSEYGKSMKATAWKTLTEKYPDRTKGVDIGDTTTLLYGFATLRVKATPKGSKISILTIKQPFSQGMQLKAGKYRLKLSKDGYVGKEINVSLKPGKTKQVSVDLDKYGHLYISTNPKNAHVKVLNAKGKYRDGMRLAPGDYRVEVSASNYIAETRSVNVKAGEKKKVTLSLLRLEMSNSIGMQFVYITPGSFDMGGYLRVKITKGFYMQTTEVTQGQWRSVMGNNLSRFSSCGSYCPVDNVSWNDAKEFIRKLNAKEGAGKYRLPTEAEWEYACRAGSDTKYANGNSIDVMGWYDKNSGDKTQLVGQKKANAWGLYDMHGNVEEWCEDWYGDYSSGNVTNPVGPSTGSERVLRGGSWDSYAYQCWSTIRRRDPPGYRYVDYGFRLVLSPGH